MEANLSNYLSQDSKITVYPNPSSGFIYINTVKDNEALEIKLTDITGKLVLKENANSVNNNCTIKLPERESIYFLEIIDSEKRIFHQKIILIK